MFDHVWLDPLTTPFHIRNRSMQNFCFILCGR